jgi:hypothetical protein
MEDDYDGDGCAAACPSSSKKLRRSGSAEGPEPAGRRKAVSFSSEADERHDSDRTLEEVRSSWYGRDDIAAFKDGRKDAIRVLKSVRFQLELVDDAVCCLRGYEAYFSLEHNRATKCAREAALRAVLQEQDRQRRSVDNWGGGLSDGGGGGGGEALRSRCLPTSEWASRNALELGARDAEYARAVYFYDSCDDSSSSDNNSDSQTTSRSNAFFWR